MRHNRVPLAFFALANRGHQERIINQTSKENTPFALRFALAFLVAFPLWVAHPASAQPSLPSEKSPDVPGDSATTQVLVLATPHLSQIAEDFSPSLLDSLIAVLETYHPEAIGIEALSGAQIAEMKRRGGAYEQVYKQFASRQLSYGQHVQEALDISWQNANLRADSLLTRVRNSRPATDETRLSLVAHLLASYRLHTAALQWSYVSDERQSSQSVVPSEAAAGLSELLRSASENASIGLRLAQKLNLQRIYPIDDHLDKDDFIEILPQLQEALGDSTLEAIRSAPHLRKYERLLEEGVEAGSLMPLYRYMNAPAYLDQDLDVQWNAFLRSNLPSGLDRSRLALWEVRNLSIAAHIRKASADHPSGRILVTIGASHKPFLDRYLSEMMGVRVVDLSDVATN